MAGTARTDGGGAGAVGLRDMSMTKPFSIGPDGSLSVPLHVLHMLNGRLPIPNKTKELLIEIGTNAFDTWDQQVLPRQPHAFLVAFEPLVDKWSLMLARNARARVVGELGWHNARGIILPFAVSDRAGVVPFYVSHADGCSLAAQDAPTRARRLADQRLRA